jgi:hypothetical protein
MERSVGLIMFEMKQYYKVKRGYWQLKGETLDHPLWRTHFGRGYGPALRLTRY